MTLEEIIPLEGAFTGALPPGCLGDEIPKNLDERIIVQAELFPCTNDPRYVHIIATTFTELVNTKRPILRRYAKIQIESLGTYLAQMEWWPTDERIVRE